MATVLFDVRSIVGRGLILHGQVTKPFEVKRKRVNAGGNNWVDNPDGSVECKGEVGWLGDGHGGGVAPVMLAFPEQAKFLKVRDDVVFLSDSKVFGDVTQRGKVVTNENFRPCVILYINGKSLEEVIEQSEAQAAKEVKTQGATAQR